MAQLDDLLASRYRAGFLGRTAAVLVEERWGRGARLTGLTDRFVRVDFDGPDRLMGRIVPVRLVAALDDRLRGEYVAGACEDEPRCEMTSSGF